MPPPPGGAHGHLTASLAALATVFAMEHDLGDCFTAETGLTGITGIRIEALSDDTKLVVRFAAVGVKTLRAKFAKLEPA